jgi:uncharacterized membrane protein
MCIFFVCGMKARCVLKILVLGLSMLSKTPSRRFTTSDVSDIPTKDRNQFMSTGSFQFHDENTIEKTVIIERPVQTVYEFYRDFRNLPRFLGDVMNIELIGPATSRWTVQGPLGIRAHWTIQVIEECPNELIRYESVTSPALKTSWNIYFSPGPGAGQTEVREVMKAPFGKFGSLALALIGKFPAEEVSANLHRLKQLLETGKIIDRSYSVKSKFRQQAN